MFNSETEGYMLVRTEDEGNYPGAIKEAKGAQGFLFVADEKDLFREIMRSALANIGTELACISINDVEGKEIEGGDAREYMLLGYRYYITHCCRVKCVISLDDYNLIMRLYKCASNADKSLVCDGSEGSLYRSALEYYAGKENMIRALQELHEKEKKIPSVIWG